MKNFLLFCVLLIMGLQNLNAQLISEFQPNPPGTDPATMDFEISGTPNMSFTGYVINIESDPSNIGVVQEANAVSGMFDANGLLVVNIPDLENPSFTILLTSTYSGSINDDLDTNDDGILDDITSLGTIYDAIGIADAGGDVANLNGASLGGQDFAYTGAEPQLVFREMSTGDWFAVNLLTDTNVRDINANTIPTSAFDSDPTIPTFGSVSPARTVPIELLTFTGDSEATRNKLNWTTSLEINNDYFNIERSSDNINFRAIGSIAGNGTTFEERYYTFIDRSPATGINYYRLAQFDYNGDMEYHKVIAVENRKESTSIYPTLTNGELTVNVDAPAKINIYSSSGNVVKQFSLEESSQIDITELSAGIYSLTSLTNGHMETHRFVKQ